MKTLRQICAATILNLTLAAAVFAGQIDCPGVAGTTSTITDVTITVVVTVVTKVY